MNDFKMKALNYRATTLAFGAFLGIILACLFFLIVGKITLPEFLDKDCSLFSEKFPLLLSNLTITILFLPNIFLLWFYRTTDTNSLIISSQNNSDINIFFQSIDLLTQEDDTTLFRPHNRIDNLPEDTKKQERAIVGSFPSSDLSNTVMKKKAIGLIEIVKFWHERESYRGTIENVISQSILQNITLKNIDFTGMNLSGIFFSGVGFDNCYFEKTTLEGSIFEYCIFSEKTNFSSSTIVGTLFRGSFIHGGNFDNCIHLNSDFSNSKLIEASFNNLVIHERFKELKPSIQAKFLTKFDNVELSRTPFLGSDLSQFSRNGHRLTNEVISLG